MTRTVSSAARMRWSANPAASLVRTTRIPRASDRRTFLGISTGDNHGHMGSGHSAFIPSTLAFDDCTTTSPSRLEGTSAFTLVGLGLHKQYCNTYQILITHASFAIII